jgi:serine protease Do
MLASAALSPFHRCLLPGILACLVGLLANFPAAGQDNELDLEERAIQAAVAKIAPSVVKIETIGGLEKVGKLLVGVGPTTGLIVDKDGYVISSAFNFIQQPTSILVTLPSGARVPATIVARDHSRMLVLLKVKTDEKLVVPIAVPRSDMQVGQWSIAVGRTFEQSGPSLSVGVLSATNRIWGKAIQTDAKISPANYGGPLIDIQGRVLGVLVPLSPQGQGSEVAGAEWYDSGIGFAVPLTEINEHLKTLEAGADLHPGLLGISLKPGDIYALQAEIVAVQANSPAYKAGLKVGDTIVEIDGAKIQRQAQLRHALGGRYAGETVNVVALRDKKRVEVSIELTEKLEPYQYPFLGILPMRGGADAQAGVAVRYVYPDSPADEAKIEVGDRLTKLDGQPATDISKLHELLAAHDPKTKVTLEIAHGDQLRTVELTPTTLPTEVPAELPPATGELKEPDEKPVTGIIEVKLPEEKNECFALVPANYHPEVPHAAVVVLHPAGKVDRDAVKKRWQNLADKHELIVIVPQSAEATRWEPTESDFIRKTLENVIGKYNIDPQRIVVFGDKSGGSMAFLTGLAHTNLFRGIAVVDAAPPARTKMPAADPVHRLAFYLALANKSPTAAAEKSVAAKLAQAKFPVTLKSLGEKPRELTDAELAELARWIDTLDRI